MTRLKSEILIDLRNWMRQNRKPEIMKSNHRDLRFEEESTPLNSLASRSVCELSRSDVTEFWASFKYLSEDGLIYFLPRILSLILEREQFPMFELTRYEFILFVFSDEGEPRPELISIAKQLSASERQIMKDFYIWIGRYRYSSESALRDHLESVHFQKLWEPGGKLKVEKKAR